MRLLLALSTLIAALTGTAGAEITYECKYTHSSSLHRWQREFRADRFVIKEVKGFVIRFLVDEASGQGYLQGGFGPEQLETRYSQNNRMITFFETTSTGNRYFTSIDLTSGDSVHSQHIYVINGSFLPAQYYGKCATNPQS